MTQGGGVDRATRDGPPSAAYRRRGPASPLDLAAFDEDYAGGFNWRMVGRFGPYLAPYRGAALASVGLMLLYTAANLAKPYLIGVAIDRFIEHHDLPGLTAISIVLLLVNVLMWQAQYWQVWTMSRTGQQVLYRLSSDMYAHLQRLSPSFYDRAQVGRVMSRLQSDITVLETMLSSGLLSMLGSVVALGGIVGIMLSMNAPLALLTFAVLPVMMIIAAFWQRHAQRSFRRTRAAISVVNATLQENISGMRVIQSLAREDRNRVEFDGLNRHNRDTNLQASGIAALVLPLVEVVAAVAIALVVVYGGMLVVQGHLQATPRSGRCCAASPCASPPARRSPSSGRPAPARAPSPRCSRASTTCRTAPCWSTATTCAR